MTSLKKRLDNVLTELAIIQEGLDTPGEWPSCCLTIQKEGTINCDTLESLPKEEFLKECQKCRTRIKEILAHFNLNAIAKLKTAQDESSFLFYY